MREFIGDGWKAVGSHARHTTDRKRRRDPPETRRPSLRIPTLYLNIIYDYYASNLPNLQHASAGSDLAAARDLVAALAREYSIELLQELHARGWSSASEVARDMGMHVATAMRKLGELQSLGLLEKRTRTGTDVVEYRLPNARVEIVLDLASAATSSAKDAWSRADRILVKEKPNRKILLESDEKSRRVRRILFLKVLRRRTEARTLELAETEGTFLWHLPFASEPARSVADICRRGGVENPLHVARILEFVREMDRLGVIEVAR